MVTLRWIAFISCAALIPMVAACGDGAANPGASGGSAGLGGSGGAPDAGVSCADTGCDDGNPCTIDGLCEPMSGECMASGVEPVDTPCGQDDLFVCDGEGRCGCNVDAQCEAFFPDNECREAPRCIDGACPPPGVLADGTPCSGGECRSGECSSPWDPKQQLVPMSCGAALFGGGSLATRLFESSMDLTVSPTEIEPTSEFSASIDASIIVPRSFLQEVVTAGFPSSVSTLEVSDARGEIRSTRVVSGSPVNTIVAPLPQSFSIPQRSTTGDPGNQVCDTDDDCPLGQFGQFCASGRCDCACQPGCSPQECANTVTDDVVLELETIHGKIYRAFPTGMVCFDVSGEAPNPGFMQPVRTGLRVTSLPGPLAIECEGGAINDNGTPDVPQDDFIDPNPPEDQVCFPIGSPQP